MTHFWTRLNKKHRVDQLAVIFEQKPTVVSIQHVKDLLRSPNPQPCYAKMKRDDTRMTDIPSDIQKHILKLLATNNGASDFVRATSSCKEWKEFAEDTEILKTVQFGRTYRLDESFWSKNGFLVKCANAGNKRASDLLVRKRKQDILRLFMQKMKAQKL